MLEFERVKYEISYHNSRSVAGKLIEIKKPPENLFITPRGTQNINEIVRSPLLPTTHVLVRMVFGDSQGIAWIEWVRNSLV